MIPLSYRQVDGIMGAVAAAAADAVADSAGIPGMFPADVTVVTQF